ncbi:helicase RepA family protein [Micromonospora zamorensis]|uniref:AAA family ATPase n=1 Tax=Micromonospora zamorensis TaxID=709883 RepID=UPI002E1EA890
MNNHYDDDTWTALDVDEPSWSDHLPDSPAALTSPRHTGRTPAEVDAYDGEALNWGDFLTQDLSQVNWTAGRLMEHGQQVALVGAGKVGKSLFTLEWAACMASGRAFLDDEPRDPIRVLYVDMENGRRDIQRRIHALGFRSTDLGNLAYLSFPPIGPLDTRQGAAAFAARVLHHNPQVVVLDTISRFIQGKENDSDTWLDLYRHTHRGLKAREIGCIRLDHFGKDTERGSRGSSAKTQDIDHVWELTSSGGDKFRLSRTHTRTGMGEGEINLLRAGRPGERGTTRHEVTFEDPEKAKWLVASGLADKLDEIGVPPHFGRDRAKAEAQKHGITSSNEVWAEALKIRKQRS